VLDVIVIKVKGTAYLYSAFNETSPQGTQVWITQGCPCKLHHTCLYLANVRQMVPPECHAILALLVLLMLCDADRIFVATVNIDLTINV